MNNEPSVSLTTSPSTDSLQRWLDSLEFVLGDALKGNPEQGKLLMNKLLARLRETGVPIPTSVSTPYINTIPPERQPEYPGDQALERRIKSYIRWNAMAMVVKANRTENGIGGHISTYASC